MHFTCHSMNFRSRIRISLRASFPTVDSITIVLGSENLMWHRIKNMVCNKEAVHMMCIYLKIYHLIFGRMCQHLNYLIMFKPISALG